MKPCTTCPAMIHGVTPSGHCQAGYKTGTIKADNRRIRVPMEPCERPKDGAELSEQIRVMQSADYITDLMGSVF